MNKKSAQKLDSKLRTLHLSVASSTAVSNRSKSSQTLGVKCGTLRSRVLGLSITLTSCYVRNSCLLCCHYLAVYTCLNLLVIKANIRPIQRRQRHSSTIVSHFDEVYEDDTEPEVKKSGSHAAIKSLSIGRKAVSKNKI